MPISIWSVQPWGVSLASHHIKSTSYFTTILTVVQVLHCPEQVCCLLSKLEESKSPIACIREPTLSSLQFFILFSISFWSGIYLIFFTFSACYEETFIKNKDAFYVKAKNNLFRLRVWKFCSKFRISDWTGYHVILD